MNKLKAIILSIVVSLFFQTSMAQENKQDQPAVLNHIAVYVDNLQTSTEFYQQLFNLKIIPEPFKDGKHTWFSLGSVGHLHLISGEGASATFNKNNHLCFSVQSIDRFIEKLNAKKIAFEDWPGKAGAVTKRVDGVKQIYFKDPDGHWLEVNDDK